LIAKKGGRFGAHHKYQSTTFFQNVNSLF